MSEGRGQEETFAHKERVAHDQITQKNVGGGGESWLSFDLHLCVCLNIFIFHGCSIYNLTSSFPTRG